MFCRSSPLARENQYSNHIEPSFLSANIRGRLMHAYMVIAGSCGLGLKIWLSITGSIRPIYVIAPLEYFFNKKTRIFNGINIINFEDLMHLFPVSFYADAACYIKILLVRL